LPDELAKSCANNFTEIGTLDILNYIKTNLTSEAKLVENIKGILKNSKGFTDLMTELMTLGLLPLINNSIGKYNFTYKSLQNIAKGAEQISKRKEYNMLI